MPYNNKAFGIVIGSLRSQKGLTQVRMAELAGLARSHLAALENGEKTVRLDTLWDIARALQMRPSELIRRVERETKVWNERMGRRPVNDNAGSGNIYSGSFGKERMHGCR